jgi:hypothetical protein
VDVSVDVSVDVIVIVIVIVIVDPDGGGASRRSGFAASSWDIPSGDHSARRWSKAGFTITSTSTSTSTLK